MSSPLMEYICYTEYDFLAKNCHPTTLEIAVSDQSECDDQPKCDGAIKYIYIYYQTFCCVVSLSIFTSCAVFRRARRAS